MSDRQWMILAFAEAHPLFAPGSVGICPPAVLGWERSVTDQIPMSQHVLDTLFLKHMRRTLFHARNVSPWHWDTAVALWFHAN